MTSPELEPGQSYDFTYRGKRLRGECLLTNGHKLLHRLYDEFDESEVTDITRVPSEEEWQRAVAALQRSASFIRNGIELGYIRMPDKGDPANEVLPLIDTALRTALGE